MSYNFMNEVGASHHSRPGAFSRLGAMRSSDRYTVPVGGGIGKLVRFGKQPVDIKLQGFYNAEKPDGAADWTMQFQLKFLFPKG